MRGLVGLYLAIGVALVAIGFLLPGPCPNRNTDIVNKIVFVLTWPVTVYRNVFEQPTPTADWLYAAACRGAQPAAPTSPPKTSP